MFFMLSVLSFNVFKFLCMYYCQINTGVGQDGLWVKTWESVGWYNFRPQDNFRIRNVYQKSDIYAKGLGKIMWNGKSEIHTTSLKVQLFLSRRREKQNRHIVNQNIYIDLNKVVGKNCYIYYNVI